MDKKARFWSVVASAAVGTALGFGYHLISKSLNTG